MGGSVVAVSGAYCTTSVRSATARMRTGVPTGSVAPSAVTARHRSPWTKTIPPGASSSRTTPISFSRPLAPVVTGRCARHDHLEDGERREGDQRQREGDDQHDGHRAPRPLRQHDQADEENDQPADRDAPVRGRDELRRKQAPARGRAAPRPRCPRR